MQRYNQDNVPEDILNRFPTLRSRPASISRVQNSQSNNPSQCSEKKHEESACSINASQCSDKSQILDELHKRFPQFNSIKNQVILDKQSIVRQSQPLLLVSQVRSLHKEFAPESLPYKEQVAINKANCSLCPQHKKTQSGLLCDLPISHESPTKNR